MESHQILKTVLTSLIDPRKTKVSENSKDTKNILNYASEVASKTRKSKQYVTIVTDVDIDEVCHKPRVMDVMAYHLFRYTQTPEERLNRAMVFLTFVADIYLLIEDQDMRNLVVEHCLELTATRLNPTDWTALTKNYEKKTVNCTVSGIVRITLAAAAVWTIMKIVNLL